MSREVHTTFVHMGEGYTLIGEPNVTKMPRKYMSMIREEQERVGIDHVKHFLYSRRWNAGYWAAAGAYFGEYAVAFGVGFKLLSEPMQRYIIRHELRHCKPNDVHPKLNVINLDIRAHDVGLYDIGCKPKKIIGFFKEDFPEIKKEGNKILNKYYSKIKDIERYLK